MGFNQVYAILQELFPQIDPRALRAVAVEHSKDADAAVETVLEEVIPFFTIRSRPDTPSTGSISVGGSTGGAISTAQTVDCKSVNAAADTTDGQNGYIANGVMGLMANLTNKRRDEGVRLANGRRQRNLRRVNGLQFERPTFPKWLSATNKDSDPDEVEPPAPFKYHDPTASLRENKSTSKTLNGKSAIVSKMESTNNIADTDDDGSMSQSRKIHMIDAFAKIKADARNNKEMLLSSMGSVICLMNEVKDKEQAAEQAKVEAAMGSPDILVKSEELKQMVKQAEEANSTHAGEVYGEKAILATELRELQSRALSLSVARDKYLAVLDEMKQTLGVRLAEAQNVIKHAEQEKMGKEKAAKEALAEQELAMEKVLQESKMLKQQAEDNAKLREFLVDRGHVVYTLQEEISVICEDVRLLKEKFDEQQIPLSKSLSSSQISFILASSVSSLKSVIPEKVESIHDEGADDSLKFDEQIPLSKSLSSSLTSFILASSGSSSKSVIPEKVESIHDEGADDSLKFDEQIPLSKSLSSSQTSFVLATSGSSSTSLIPEKVESIHDEGADDSLVDTQEKEGSISCSTEDLSHAEAVRNPNDHKSHSDDEWEICDYDS